MITQESCEKIISGINSHVNELNDLIGEFGDVSEATDAKTYKNAQFAKAKINGLELALMLIEDYKDRSPGLKTPLGLLTVEESMQPGEYTGFSFYLEGEIVGAVEYENANGLIVYTYGDLTDDDPTHVVTVENIEEQLATHKNT